MAENYAQQVLESQRIIITSKIEEIEIRRAALDDEFSELHVKLNHLDYAIAVAVNQYFGAPGDTGHKFQGDNGENPGCIVFGCGRAWGHPIHGVKPGEDWRSAE